MTAHFSRTALVAALLAAAFLSTACSSTPGKASAPVAAAPAHAPALKDAALADAVKAAIDANAELKKFNIKVTGKGSDVTLAGNVDNGGQMANAGMIAEKVKGVQFVINNLMPKN